MDLSKLALPFPADDIEWRVSRAGIGPKGIFCCVLAYITNRAVQQRLDEVCGPENWRNESLQVFELRTGVVAMQAGISIRIGDEWVTKWDVAEPTNIEPGKGGFSGAMKRAGAQWGIGRYLYRLDETFAETSEAKAKGWNYATLPEKHGGGVYYWKAPSLPGFALPKDQEHEISDSDLKDLKRTWRAKFAPDVKSPAELLEGFTRFVTSIVGDFPSSDYTCWAKVDLEKCLKRIEETTDKDGPSSDIPFEE
jgi:hypothetical protein